MDKQICCDKKTYLAFARSDFYTKPKYLSAKVTAISSASSTVSPLDAKNTAQHIADSTAQNNTNIINQTLDIYSQISNNSASSPIIGTNGNIYITSGGKLYCLYSNYEINWIYESGNCFSSSPCFQTFKILILTNDNNMHIVNAYNGTLIEKIKL